MIDPNSRYIGAIDQGTTSTRFIVFDAHGRVVSVAQKEHEQIFPKPGWVEHDPNEIWRNTRRVVVTALEQAGLRHRSLAAIGITNQRETTILWDRRTGEPLYNAIVWQDTRVDDLVEQYRREAGVDRFREATGLPLASYFSALKLKWILDNAPRARARAAAGHALFGTIDAWLVWNLTGGRGKGVHVTDVTNASRTQLMNLATLEWDDDLLAAFGVPHTILPRVASSSERYATASIPELEGVPIAGILGDQQAALVGQTCFAPGQTKNTYGTGSFVVANTGEEIVTSAEGLITTVAYRFGEAPARYALEGSIAVTGAAIQWLRDNLRIITSSGEVEALANEVEDNGGVYFVPAFSGLYAPHWQQNARGLIIGLTRYATRAHVARAALEAAAYQTKDVVDAMAEAAVPIRELRVDGGMVRNRLLMQFQADILGVPVLKPSVTETTCLGAAYAAGLAVGYWSGVEELERHWTLDERVEPRMPEAERRVLHGSWRKAVERSFDWL